ncbi:MAG: phosphate ABC transporter ATP-binding protein PstB [Thaumarchaeota archaeon]|nr:phosphate ABC transporter ATP-binding protein PstB [Nitrososphaerota archaeon]
MGEEGAKEQPSSAGPIIGIKNLNVWYGKQQVLYDVDFSVERQRVTAIIGPSGCGKSTLVRTMNRLHDLVPNSRLTGEIKLDGANIYGDGTNPADIRRRVGMVFQKPNPFPNLSIRDNVVAGLKQTARWDKKVLDEVAQTSLEKVSLWDEVKEKLGSSGASLSGGQQQRLCIARALAVKPEVLLMDEPCSALDPLTTAKIEDLVVELKSQYTVVIVTHNLQQAARVSDSTALMYLGKVVEHDATDTMFLEPKEELTRRYVAGKFG